MAINKYKEKCKDKIKKTINAYELMSDEMGWRTESDQNLCTPFLFSISLYWRKKSLEKSASTDKKSIENLGFRHEWKMQTSLLIFTPATNILYNVSL